MKNLGPVSKGWLRAVGIRSVDDLRSIGPVAAFLLVRESGVRPSLNLLWALEAATRNMDWRDLTADDKERLRIELARQAGRN